MWVSEEENLANKSLSNPYFSASCILLPPWRLRGVHLEGKVVGSGTSSHGSATDVTAPGGVTVESLASVALGETSQESAETAVGVLQLGHPLLLLLGLVGILDDGMPVEWGTVVHFQDGRELVRVHQVDDRDGEPDQAAAGPGNKD